MIRTKTPILIDTKTNRSEVVYFDCIAEQRNDIAIFKDQIGLYAYLIRMQILVDGKLEDLSKFYPHLKPQQAIYKLSTWRNLFGELTPNEMDAQKDSLMIGQIAYNSNDWFGLGENDLEVVE